MSAAACAHLLLNVSAGCDTTRDEVTRKLQRFAFLMQCSLLVAISFCAEFSEAPMDA